VVTVDPETVVRDFLTRLETGDSRAAIALLDPDIVWRNTGLPTLRGRRATGALMAMEKRGIGLRVEFHHVAADSETVLTDRTDYISWKRWENAFWVRGTFVVRDGLIVVWDDAFGWGSLLASSALGALKALDPRTLR
jgi:limonene-1,2-epoxide hydrolase